MQKEDVVLLVEDLITTAKSKFEFVDGVNASGGVVEDIFVVFDRLEGGAEALSKRDITLHALTDMDMQLEIGLKHNYMTDKELAMVDEYREGPKKWNISRGHEWHEVTE